MLQWLLTLFFCLQLQHAVLLSNCITSIWGYNGRFSHLLSLALGCPLPFILALLLPPLSGSLQLPPEVEEPDSAKTGLPVDLAGDTIVVQYT